VDVNEFLIVFEKRILVPDPSPSRIMIPQSKSHSSAARSDNQPIAIASTSSTTNLSITSRLSLLIISDISCEIDLAVVGAIGLPSVKLPLRAPSPFVKIVVANYLPRRTQVIKKSTAPIWNEEFFLWEASKLCQFPKSNWLRCVGWQCWTGCNFRTVIRTAPRWVFGQDQPKQ